MDDWLQLLVGLGVGGLLVEALRGLMQRRNNSANYAEVISRSTVVLLEPLHAQIADLQQRLGEALEQLDQALEEVSLLRQQVQATGASEATGRAARESDHR